MTTYTAEQLVQITDDELRRVIAGLMGYTSLRYSAQSGLMYGITPLLSELRAVPEWATDANPALCLHEEFRGELYYSRPYAVWCVKLHIPPGEEMTIIQNASAPRAISEAWVLWRQAQG